MQANLSQLLFLTKTRRQAESVLRAAAATKIRHRSNPPRASNADPIDVVYDDNLYRGIRRQYHLGAALSLADAALINSFRCQSPLSLRDQIAELVQWRIRCGDHNFVGFIYELYQCLYSRDQDLWRSLIALEPSLHFTNVNSLINGQTTAAEYVSITVTLIGIQIPWEYSVLLAESFIGKISRDGLRRIITAAGAQMRHQSSPGGTTNAELISSILIGHWGYTKGDLTQLGLPITSNTLGIFLATESLDERRFYAGLNELLRHMRGDLTPALWEMVFRRSDPKLCRWLLERQCKMPDLDLLYKYRDSLPDSAAKQRCNSMIAVYESPRKQRCTHKR